ncbi:MAG: PTS galactitol transporter subunit IIB [Propionibacteriaceae bacterium]|jgi:PTS system galactitol-specific IIB component|nr:PTS galactitol transporter subunit IIB [Propionibacteriaceae bacterium]
MKPKKILVACGGAVATSTVAAECIRQLCARHGISADVQQCRIPELTTNLQGADLIVTTAKVAQDYGVPLVHGIAFISGVNVEATEAKILGFLSPA